jgi:fatty-acyl-CoA synthase
MAIGAVADIERIECDDFLWDAPASTYELIRRGAHSAPAHPAITFLPTGDPAAPPITLSRSALLQQVHRAANMFGALGVGGDDVISCLLPQFLEAQVVFWGAQAAGIINPINFLLGPRQICAILNAVRTKVLVAAGPQYDPGLWRKVEAVREHAPSLRTIVVIGGESDPDRNIRGFHELLADAAPDELIYRRSITPGDTATIFHTSGSTGRPKLIRHTHRNEVAAAWSTARLFDFDDQDVICNGLPLFHVAAPILLSLAPWAAGSTIWVPTAAGMRDPTVLQNYWKLVERDRVTVVGGVPTSLLELTRIPLGDADLSSARYALTGGAPLTSGLSERFTRHTGLQVRQMYGMTETAGIIAGAPLSMQIRPGQVGVRAPGVELKIVKIGSSTPCLPGERGEVLVRGLNVAAGNPEDQPHEQTERRWFNTGDIGYLDAEGVLTLTGRTKDVIIRSGHNIDPATIEAAAGRHPAVKTCAAVGQPDKRAGEVPVLFVVLEAGATADAAELNAFVAGQVDEAPAKPARVIIVDALPLNAVGKIFRPQLRCEAIRYVIEQEIAQAPTVAGLSWSVRVELDDNSFIKSRIELDCSAADVDAGRACKADLLSKLDQYAIDVSIDLVTER